jgi:hypothetical protein
LDLITLPHVLPACFQYITDFPRAGREYNVLF